MLTREQIAKDFGLDDDLDIEGNPLSKDAEILDRLETVQDVGKRHGAKGWYPDGEFASDADWVYGVGAEIQALEELLEDDFGSVLSLYSEAHSEALEPQDNAPFCRCEMCVPGDVTCIGGEDD